MTAAPDARYEIQSPRVTLRRRGAAPWLRAATFASPAVGVAMAFATLSMKLEGLLATLLIGMPFVMAVLFAIAASVAARRGAVHGQGRVGVAEGRLEVPTGPAIALAQIESAFTVPGNHVRYTRVELRLRGGDRASIDLARPEDGEPLLAAAGVAASDRRLAFRVGGGGTLARAIIGHGIVGAIVGAFAMIFAEALPGADASGARFLTWATVTLGAVLIAVARFGPGRVEVGRDGVLIRHGLRRRFVPFARIAEVHLARSTAYTPASDVFLRIDRPRLLALGVTSLPEDERIGLATRIGTARIEASVGHDRLERLDRAGRTVAAWRDGLRQLASRATGYREATIPREDLVRVLDDPGTAAERRIAAAIALAGSGDDDARTRVRVAASACANPPLRDALERAASDALDDAAIERAVASSRG